MQLASVPDRASRLLRPLVLLLGAFSVAAVLATAVAAPAFAHADLLDSSPAADSTVSALPDEIVLTFSADLIAAPGATEVVVVDESGASVADGEPTVVGPTMTQRLSPSASDGVYTVTWKVVYADGHPGSSSYSFTVAGSEEEQATPSPAPASAQPTAQPNASASARPTAAPSAAGTADMLPAPAWVWVLSIAGILASTAAAIWLAVRYHHNGTSPTADSDSAR